MRDIDVRKTLLENELSVFREDGVSRIVQELSLCQGAARVDVAVVNGQLHGYEIKSKNDTLERLPGQVEVYSRVLDRCALVVEESHLEKALALVPEWWGVMSVWETSGEVRMFWTRKGENNPAPDPYALAQLLWQREAMQILERHGLSAGMEKKARRHLWQRLAEGLDHASLSREVRTTLKGRSSWRVDSAQTPCGGLRRREPMSSGSRSLPRLLRIS